MVCVSQHRRVQRHCTLEQKALFSEVELVVGGSTMKPDLESGKEEGLVRTGLPSGPVSTRFMRKPSE